jgi:DNA modification methylase
VSWRIKQGDWLEVLKTMPNCSVHCVVTSPPYWGLRDYGVAGQLGLERTPEEYVAKMVEGFREVRRVLRDDGTCWVNLGDSYASNGGHSDSQCNDRRGEYNIGRRPEHEVRAFRARAGSDCDPKRGSAAAGQPKKHCATLKPKDLTGVPWLVAFALRADGWYLRQDIIWAKPNPMPESVTDRCTKSHEYIFLLTKSARYWYDQNAILEPVSESTHARLAQDVEAQIGSERANGGHKTNGNMKAVARTPTSYKGSVPGRRGGPGQDRRSDNDRSARKLAASGSGIKSNESFSNAVCCLVEQRNKRSVWTVTTRGYAEAHFATFPPEIPEICIKAGCPEGGTVLDPFCGAGTTGMVAKRLMRSFVGIELNPQYVEMARRRIVDDAPLFNSANEPATEAAQCAD